MKSSHILCKVDDLSAAIDAFRAAGFEVEWGNDPATAINALIWFESGPFLELIDAEGARPPVEVPWIDRFDRWRDQAPGWCDLALETDSDATPETEAARAAGLEIAGPFANHRTPPGGVTVHIRTSFPHDQHLPFFMGAYQPNPRPSAVDHPNGAVAVTSISFGIDDGRRTELDHLVDADDPWLVPTSDGPGVRSVTIRGLREPIPADAVSGAVILRAEDG
ncbi:MAG: VOC family protein [Actinomycetota bacterium]